MTFMNGDLGLGEMDKETLGIVYILKRNLREYSLGDFILNVSQYLGQSLGTKAN